MHPNLGWFWMKNLTMKGQIIAFALIWAKKVYSAWKTLSIFHHSVFSTRALKHNHKMSIHVVFCKSHFSAFWIFALEMERKAFGSCQNKACTLFAPFFRNKILEDSILLSFYLTSIPSAGLVWLNTNPSPSMPNSLSGEACIFDFHLIVINLLLQSLPQDTVLKQLPNNPNSFILQKNYFIAVLFSSLPSQ